jgi:phosphatidylinositol 4-kinase
MEDLPLTLTPYEIVSLGPSSGIIEMVRDATTFDSLKRLLSNQYFN